MVAVRIEYLGDLRCQALHGESGTELTTDAPKDNQGRGESFSPTDLLASALGSCILSVMGIKARALNIEIGGATAIVEKEMANAPVRRVHKLAVRIHVPQQLSQEHRHKLEEAAHSCPVHKSMHPDVQIPIEFSWG